MRHRLSDTLWAAADWQVHVLASAGGGLVAASGFTDRGPRRHNVRQIIAVTVRPRAIVGARPDSHAVAVWRLGQLVAKH